MIYKCDACGRFISLKDAGAVRKLLTPDSQFTTETYETLCKQHADGKVLVAADIEAAVKAEVEAKAASLAGEKGNG